MFRIGIRLFVPAARRVRHFGESVTATSPISRSMLHNQLWERLSNRKARHSSPLCALSMVAISAGSSLYVRADSGEELTIVPEQQPSTEGKDSNVCSATRSTAEGKRTKSGIIETIFFKKMDSQSREFLYGLLGANVVVHLAFVFAFFLNKPPKPSPTLLRFLSRNFVLSLGWLSRGRWHVMLTCMFAHLTGAHLIRNMWGMLTGVWLCSDFLDVWRIAGLYFGGGLVGASASMALTSILRKPRYVTAVTGASDGVYALWYYWLLAQDWEDSKVLSVPLEPFMKGVFVYVAVAEAVGLRKYIRYGYTGRGLNAVKGNHAAHLGGALTGIATYGAPHILESIRRKVINNDSNEGTELEPMPARTQEAVITSTERMGE